MLERVGQGHHARQFREDPRCLGGLRRHVGNFVRAVMQGQDRRLAMLHAHTPQAGRGLSNVRVGGRRRQDGPGRIGRWPDSSAIPHSEPLLGRNTFASRAASHRSTSRAIQPYARPNGHARPTDRSTP